MYSSNSNGWANGAGPAARLALRGRVRFGDAPVDLGDRLLQLRAAPFVSGRAQLTLELGAGQPQRFERVHAFRIADRLGQSVRSRPLHFFHALLNPRLGIDQSFA